MTSLMSFIGSKTNKIIGLKVSASKSVIGTVTGVVKDEDNRIESVNVRKDRDSTTLTVHQNRIQGIDEEKGVLVIN